MKKNILTVPNFLSLCRIGLTISFFITFYFNKNITSIIIFVVAIFTDFLDGLFARLLKQKSPLGSFLDPLADKLLIILTIVLFMIKSYIPWWFFTIIITREILVSTGWIITYQFNQHNLITKPRFLGKVAVALEMITIAIVMINIFLKFNVIKSMLDELYFLTSLFALGSLVDYISFARKFYQQ